MRRRRVLEELKDDSAHDPRDLGVGAISESKDPVMLRRVCPFAAERVA